MPEVDAIDGFPGIALVNALRGEPRPLPAGSPKPTAIEHLTDMSHIERHFGAEALGFQFLPNDHFGNAQELTTLLQDVATTLVPQEDMDKSHIFTFEFNREVGKIGVAKIQEGERVTVEIRDQEKRNEAEVNTVRRPAKPATNLITCEFKPVVKNGNITFQLTSAFPGEPAPRTITKDRITRHANAPAADPDFESDKAYWEKHAFINVTDIPDAEKNKWPIPGFWFQKEHIPLPHKSDIRDGSTGYGYDRMIVSDKNTGEIVAVAHSSQITSRDFDRDADLDIDAIEKSILDHMHTLSPQHADHIIDYKSYSQEDMVNLGLDPLYTELDDLLNNVPVSHFEIEEPPPSPED